MRGSNVMWYFPKKKRPFAHSTKATSDLIAVLAEQHDTIQDVLDNVHFDEDAKKILREYVNKGYGNTIARTWFKY